MAKRRHKLSKPEPPKKPKKKLPILYEKDMVTSMPPPNGLMPLEPSEIRGRWPLMLAKHTSNKSERLVGVFVSEMHGADHWRYWAAHPPSWMDPILFVRICLRDERVQELVERAFRHNNTEYARKLEPILQEIFETKYLPLMFAKFDRACPILADYLVRNHASKKTDPRNKPSKSRRRRQS